MTLFQLRRGGIPFYASSAFSESIFTSSCFNYEGDGSPSPLPWTRAVPALLDRVSTTKGIEPPSHTGPAAPDRADGVSTTKGIGTPSPLVDLLGDFPEAIRAFQLRRVRTPFPPGRSVARFEDRSSFNYEGEESPSRRPRHRRCPSALPVSTTKGIGTPFPPGGGSSVPWHGRCFNYEGDRTPFPQTLYQTRRGTWVLFQLQRGSNPLHACQRGSQGPATATVSTTKGIGTPSRSLGTAAA